MMTYPLFGVGADNFPRAEGTISIKAKHHLDGEGIGFMAPHNSFVQIGAETGVPGLLLWSSLCFGGALMMRRLRRRVPNAWEFGDPEERFLHAGVTFLPVAWIGFIATAFFVSFAYLDPIYTLSAISAGTYVTVRRRLAMTGPTIQAPRVAAPAQLSRRLAARAGSAWPRAG